MRLNRIVILFVSVLAVFAGQLDAFGQAAGAGEERTLQTADGWPIRITYYESTAGKEAPVVVLFPGVEGFEASRTRKVWEGVAKKLHADKYAVVLADLRKHGDSLPPTESDDERSRLTRLTQADYSLMVTQDLEAIKAFLVEEHQREKLNIRKLGLGSAGSGCLVAAAFAANDWLKKPWPDAPVLALRTPRGQDVRAILMLSPEATVRGLDSTGPIREIATPVRGIAVHIYYNPSNRSEKRAAERLFRPLDLRNNDPQEARMLIPGPPDEVYSAEGLLQDKAGEVMETKILEFFNKFVKDRPEPWKTRTSRLQ